MKTDTVLDTLSYYVKQQPEATLLITADKVLTYKDFEHCAKNVAYHLLNSGVKAGDRIGILLENYDEFFVALYGIWMAGCTAVPINMKVQEDIQASIIKTSNITTLIGNNISSSTADVNMISVNIKELMSEQRTISVVDLPPEFEALILFTSGSTGTPKGVPQTLYSISSNAWLTSEAVRLNSSDRILINTPPYYTSGICHFLTLQSKGGSFTGIQGFMFGDNMFAILSQYQCTGFGGAPVNLIRALAALQTPRKVANLRFWISSGDHLSIENIERTIQMLPGISLFYMYGLTEVSGRLFIKEYSQSKMDHIGSVGTPLKGMSATIRDSQGEIVPDGELGEIYVQGPLLTRGYLNLPEINKNFFTPFGFKTGDIGRMSSDAYLWVEGRADDMIKIGGEKVSTLQIENALRELDLFADVAVIAIDDDMSGKMVIAFVVVKDGKAFNKISIMKSLKDVLPPFSLPARILELNAIPRTGSGKVIRKELQQYLEQYRN